MCSNSSIVCVGGRQRRFQQLSQGRGQRGSLFHRCFMRCRPVVFLGEQAIPRTVRTTHGSAHRISMVSRYFRRRGHRSITDRRRRHEDPIWYVTVKERATICVPIMLYDSTEDDPPLYLPPSRSHGRPALLALSVHLTIKHVWVGSISLSAPIALRHTPAVQCVAWPPLR